MIDENLPTKTIINQIQSDSNLFQTVKSEVKKAIIGQDELIDSILIALLSDGHVLLEGVPGIAKTTLVKAITRAIGLRSNRIQFTPDLLPSDIIGTLIYNQKTNEFETKKGPIFTNFVLADEINRTSPKVQSALLEAMQERQVTIGETTFKLERPFLVFATQNPIEQEGTYRLPEAQLDRFMFKLLVSYPTKEAEYQILMTNPSIDSISKIVDGQTLQMAQALVKQIHVDEKIIQYIVNIIGATRYPAQYGLPFYKTLIQHGASPRGTKSIYEASRAFAFLMGDYFVTPDHVKKVAPHVLQHRITPTYEAEAEGILSNTIITTILEAIPTP